MADRVSVLLPTKGRYKALSDSITSLSNTTYAKELIDLIVVTDDDSESVRIVHGLFAHIGHMFHNVMLIESEERLYPIKAFNKALDHINTDYFCWMNDENSYEPNWLVRNLEQFKIYFPDKIGLMSLYKKKKAGLGLTTKQFVDYNYGEWFPECYKLYYADDELTARAILLGRYAWSEQSGVFHDEVITKAVSAISWEDKIKMKKIDRGIFYQRSETNFGLVDDEIYPWEGFCQVNFPLKRRVDEL
jgi:glycosyltransferase involved in cell wall biosynthesis